MPGRFWTLWAKETLNETSRINASVQDSEVSVRRIIDGQTVTSVVG